MGTLRGARPFQTPGPDKESPVRCCGQLEDGSLVRSVRGAMARTSTPPAVPASPLSLLQPFHVR
jgi:hypothetical protein